MALLTRFLNARSSLEVSESALPMTGMTLTRGDRRRMSSMSISRRLKNNFKPIDCADHPTGTHAWPVGEMKYKHACTRLSLNRGFRLMRDCSAKMSSYWRSKWLTISWKLHHSNILNKTDVVKEDRPHANSLSMLSPNPGVSTIVSAMRTPSSSSSTSHEEGYKTRRWDSHRH